jgi:hypothetical protein
VESAQIYNENLNSAGEPYGLNEDQIRGFLRRSSSNEPVVIGEEQREKQNAYIKLADQYYSVINPDYDVTTNVATRLDKENRFIQSIQEVVEETGELQPFETRILSHDFIAMYGLIVEGELDQIYDKYIVELRSQGADVPTNDQAIEDLKVELASGFLNRLHQKNKEVQFAHSSPVTVGNEVEFHNDLTDLTHIAFLPAESVSDGNQRLLDRLNENSEWHDLLDNDGTLKNIAIEHVDSVAALGQLTDKKGKSLESRVDYKKRHPFKLHKDNGSVLEVVQNPASSPKLLLREIMMLRKYGGLNGSLRLHQTVGGIELSEEHTEIMDVTLISCAAGFAEYDTFTDEEIDRIMAGETLQEKFRKQTYNPSDEDTGSVFYSFHKARKGRDIVPYPLDISDEGNSVEKRSMPAFKEGSFINLVRDCTFTYLGGCAIRAVQKPEKLREDQDIALVDAWNTMQTQWGELLDEAAIYNPENEERYIRIDQKDNLANMDKTTEYDRTMTQVVLESQINPDFRNAARKIVREYSKKVKSIIKYK